MSTVKAVVTIVKLGLLEFEGLMLPNGEYAIAAAQLERLNLAQQKTGSIVVKRLLGKEISLNKVASELNSNPVVILSLDQFTEVIKKLTKDGHSVASEIAGDLIGLSLTQVFSDAFGVKFDKEERQHWLTARAKARKQHQPCVTDHWCKEDGIESGVEYAIRTKTLKAACGIKTTTKVNDMNTDEVILWSMAQSRYGNARELGLNHRQAIEFVKKLQK